VRLTLAIALLWMAAGCYKPPVLSTAIEYKRRSGEVALTLQVKNRENRVTTPILVELDVQTREGGAWSKPAPMMRPAAFVLNRHEERDITVILPGDATAVRTMLTVKEGETGHLLKSERAEKTLN
jgi:hypothetical protein